VAPPIGQGYKVYSAEERAHFAADPKYHLQMRKEIEEGMNGSFGIFHAGSPAQKMVREHMVSEMKRKLNNPKLEKLLTPEWSVGCRRITPGTNYLESLSAPNVKVVYGEIDKITEKGPIVDDGNEYPVDVLICATGFDTTFKPRFPLIGTTGEKLNEVWKGIHLLRVSKNSDH
jgi:cyclohexanone monooxygenase